MPCIPGSGHFDECAVYCAPDRVLSRRWLLLSLAAPQVLVPAVALAVGGVWAAAAPVAWLVVVANLLGGFGDLFAAIATVRAPFPMFADTVDGLFGVPGHVAASRTLQAADGADSL